MNLPARRTSGLEPRHRPAGLWDWDPFREFEHLWNQMGQLFGQPAAPSGTPAGQDAWMPLAEVEETDDAYLVRVELPGIPRENVHLDIDDNELQITGEELTEEQRGKVLSRRGGRFFYRTALPAGIDGEKVEAELSEGILRVRVPKSGHAKKRRISIGGKA